MKISFALICLLATAEAVEPGHKARQCSTNSDCGNNYCCGTLKPKDTRYNSYDLTKKYCEKKGATTHLDIDEYQYDFTCPNGGKGISINVPAGFVGLYDDKYRKDWVTDLLWVVYFSYAIGGWFGIPVGATLDFVYACFHSFLYTPAALVMTLAAIWKDPESPEATYYSWYRFFFYVVLRSVLVWFFFTYSLLTAAIMITPPLSFAVLPLGWAYISTWDISYDEFIGLKFYETFMEWWKEWEEWWMEVWDLMMASFKASLPQMWWDKWLAPIWEALFGWWDLDALLKKLERLSKMVMPAFRVGFDSSIFREYVKPIVDYLAKYLQEFLESHNKPKEVTHL